MKIEGKEFRTIWIDNQDNISIIDQRHLPFKLVIETILSVDQMVAAIQEMHLRGAGLIGVAGAYGVCLALKESFNDVEKFQKDICKLKNARPTAVNLKWAIDTILAETESINDFNKKIIHAYNIANNIAENDIDMCKKIGNYGFQLIEKIYKSNSKKTVNILTHCNAGWLAFVDIGTATAPIYKAKEKGIPIHVWVDETRPRNQGALLTAWELSNNDIPHTIIADNTGGHLMQQNMVDMVIVGTDRTTRNGDVANKIGTYLKALAAKDNNVPFYVTLPTSSIDWSITNGIGNIIIEERDEKEVRFIEGIDSKNNLISVQIANPKSKALNYAFDVTPSRLVTGFITEKGVCSPNHDGLFKLFQQE